MQHDLEETKGKVCSVKNTKVIQVVVDENIFITCTAFFSIAKKLFLVEEKGVRWLTFSLFLTFAFLVLFRFRLLLFSKNV